MDTIRLLVVSREMGALRPLWSFVESSECQVESTASAWDAMDRVQSGIAPHLLILDLPRGDSDTLHVLRCVRRVKPELPIILLCHSADAAIRKDAIRLGASDVLIRPFQEEHLRLVISRLLQPCDSEGINTESIGVPADDQLFVSVSPLMQRLRTQAELLGQIDVPVLIAGESGSGKETIARLIHQFSVRSALPFLKVNCHAVSADLLEREVFGGVEDQNGSNKTSLGKFDLARKGSVFFEEITEAPGGVQERVARALLRREFTRIGSTEAEELDVRVLASTSTHIERALSSGKLREDLYHALTGFIVHVPPLRQRQEEIPILLRHFMSCQSHHYGLPTREFSPETVAACKQYAWPGNLAELESFTKRYLVAGEVGGAIPSDPKPSGLASLNLVSPDSGDGSTSPKSLKSLLRSVRNETERNAIGLALERTGWNRKAAARLLKVSYRTLLYKIQQYEMKSSESFFSPLDDGNVVAQSEVKRRIG